VRCIIQMIGCEWFNHHLTGSPQELFNE